MVNVGKYTSPMDPMGTVLYIAGVDHHISENFNKDEGLVLAKN